MRRRGRGRAHARAGMLAPGRRGMKVKTDTDRVQHSRKLVMEFLASSVDVELDQPGRAPVDDRVRGASRSGSARRWTTGRPGSGMNGGPAITTIRRPDGRGGGDTAGEDRQRALRAGLLPLHPLLQVRRGVRGRRAEHVRDRRRGPRVRRAHLHGVRRPVERIRVRLLRQLHRRVSDGRVDVHVRARDARGGAWDENQQAVVDTICPYCGVGCKLELHVQDNEIVKVTSPWDNDVTNGHLCIKGRFGFPFVQSRKGDDRPRRSGDEP